MTTQLATHNLGILCLQQNRSSEVEKLILRSSKYLESSLGPVHVATLSAFHNQVLLFRRQGRIGEARKLLEKMIEGWKESGEGVGEPEAGSKRCLAKLLDEFSEDDNGEAERLVRKAAVLYSHALGEDHPQTKEAFERVDAACNDVAMGRMRIS